MDRRRPFLEAVEPDEILPIDAPPRAVRRRDASATDVDPTTYPYSRGNITTTSAGLGALVGAGVSAAQGKSTIEGALYGLLFGFLIGEGFRRFPGV